MDTCVFERFLNKKTLLYIFGVTFALLLLALVFFGLGYYSKQCQIHEAKEIIYANDFLSNWANNKRNGK